MSQYQGKEVTILRASKADDKGYVAGQDQVWIRNADGTENVAPRDQVK